MHHTAVVGSSGSGTTTTARVISSGLGIPRLELDSVSRHPGWTPLQTDGFQDAVRTFAAQEAWAVDGNYTSHGIADLVSPRADTVVWFDLSRAQATRRVANRTLRRLSRGEQLWNGNKEGWLDVVDSRPEHNVIL